MARHSDRPEVVVLLKSGFVSQDRRKGPGPGEYERTLNIEGVTLFSKERFQSFDSCPDKFENVLMI